MPSAEDPPSSPPTRSTAPEDAIAYYKAQYEQLEAELADFQTSSRELETELEKEIEASEKRERKLKEKAEALKYEVEEWKTKYKQAKAEANTAQNALQKEITTLREGNRSLQLKLRDIEVANDDFERQARHTTSSLEDMESKYNITIERGVLLEEEIKNGEQERESLRIQTQRLRDELSDMKVETHILQEKLRKAESAIRRYPPAPLSESGMPTTPQTVNGTDNFPTPTTTTTATSSPTVATPPSKSVASSLASDLATPPSPPFSESSATASTAAAAPPSKPAVTSGFPRPRVSISDSVPGYRASIHSRGTSIQTSNGRLTPSVASRRNTGAIPQSGLPKSGSLYQIRGLIGKMQKLEQRVQSARSRLPAPAETPSRRTSPRSGSVLDHSYIPPTVTLRSSRKRNSGSVASSRDGETTPFYQSYSSRNSFGTPQPTPSRRGGPEESRPSSRASMSSRCSAVSGIPQPARPDSRQSFGGSSIPKTPMSNSSAADRHRPRSSLSNYNPSASMSHIDEHEVSTQETPTPRRIIMNPAGGSGSGLPAPGFAAQKRQSGGAMSGIPGPRRISSGLGRRGSDMPPPERKKSISANATNAVADLGETY